MESKHYQVAVSRVNLHYCWFSQTSAAKASSIQYENVYPNTLNILKYLQTKALNWAANNLKLPVICFIWSCNEPKEFQFQRDWAASIMLMDNNNLVEKCSIAKAK